MRLDGLSEIATNHETELRQVEDQAMELAGNVVEDERDRRALLWWPHLSKKHFLRKRRHDHDRDSRQ